jgi:hypothetical protein
MLNVISNPNAVTVDLPLTRSAVASRRAARKSKQSLYDALAALAGMALVLATWYGLNLALQIITIKDAAPFLAD